MLRRCFILMLLRFSTSLPRTRLPLMPRCAPCLFLMLPFSHMVTLLFSRIDALFDAAGFRHDILPILLPQHRITPAFAAAAIDDAAAAILRHMLSPPHAYAIFRYAAFHAAIRIHVCYHHCRTEMSRHRLSAVFFFFTYYGHKMPLCATTHAEPLIAAAAPYAALLCASPC